MEQITSADVFDRKFVVAASIIGTLYAAVVVVLGAAVGKEAAGVAGVALTALATGIFKQFETLRFRAIAESETREVKVPGLSFSRIALLCFSFIGSQVFLGMVAGVVLASFDLMPQMTGIENFLDLLTNWRILVSICGVTGFANFVVGFIVPRAFQLSMYSDITIAALLSVALQSFGPLVPFMVKDVSMFFDVLKSGGLWQAMFWLFYVACAFIGARLGTGKQKSGDAGSAQPLRIDTT